MGKRRPGRRDGWGQGQLVAREAAGQREAAPGARPAHRDEERPPHRDEEWPPLAATRESPHTKTKRPNTVINK